MFNGVNKVELGWTNRGGTAEKPGGGFSKPKTEIRKPGVGFPKPATEFPKPVTDFPKPATETRKGGALLRLRRSRGYEAIKQVWTFADLPYEIF